MIVPCCVTVAVDDDLRRTHERLWRDALRHAGVTLRQASQEAEIDQSQLTRLIAAHEGPQRRLQMQPLDVWRWYGLLLVQEFGLPKEVRRSARLALAVIGRKRMARMRAPESARRRA